VSETKTCITCGQTFPATTAHFHKSKDGFNPRCRKCRNKKERKARANKRNEKLEEIEKGAVDLFLKSARLGGASIPHSSELLEVLFEYFGGVRGFGNAFMKQFFQAPVGGAFRTKMLDTMVRLVTQNTAMGGAKKPLELMTDQELEAEVRRQVLEAAMSITVNGKVEKDEVRNLPVVGEDNGVIRDMQTVPAKSGGFPGDEEHGLVRRVEAQ
jgi:hypothetical protein